MLDYKKNLSQLKGPSYKDLNIKVKDHIVFSFEFFREIKYFELGDCANQWFVSLLEAINRYSLMSIDDIKGKKSLRYHKIDWNEKNIPIRFKDLDWLPNNEQLLVSPDEIYQLSITTGTGRIVGFSIDRVFYVVLLDPKHNIQPSEKHNYQVTPTYPSETQYIELKHKYDLLLKSAHNALDAKLLEQITLSSPQNNILYVSMTDDDINNYYEYCCDVSITDLITEHTYNRLESEPNN